MTPKEMQQIIQQNLQGTKTSKEQLRRLRAINAALRKQNEEIRCRIVENTKKKLSQGTIDPETVQMVHAIGHKQRDIAYQVAREQIRELLRHLVQR